VSSDCNFFDLSGKEVIKYHGLKDLEQKLRDVFDNAEYVRESLTAAEEYANNNSGPVIAKQFIELFDKVLGKSLHPASTSLY
jgi:hypothetical protein